MRKLLFILFLAVGSLAYGQELNTLSIVGSGRNSGGGDSKKEAYIKILTALKDHPGVNEVLKDLLKEDK